MSVIKICGIRRLEDAVAAADAGADLLGFVFAPSRRRISPDLARSIIRDVGVDAVGVFVDAAPDEMNRIAAQCDLRYIQLSGNEPDEVVTQLDTPVIRAVHVSDGATDLEARLSAAPGDVLLLDTGGTGLAGGTGRTFDWSLVPALERPVLLAGGLRPENVGDAIRTVRPWGVDVSSGVENADGKDPELMRAFVAGARAAYHRE